MKTVIVFWQAFFLYVTSRRLAPDKTFAEWIDACETNYRERRIVHKAKTEWIFSGTMRNENGVIQDAGYLRSPKPMNRARALKYFRREFPRATVLHIDDKNKIITYMF
jgi:hypothetical protein